QRRSQIPAVAEEAASENLAEHAVQIASDEVHGGERAAAREFPCRLDPSPRRRQSHYRTRCTQSSTWTWTCASPSSRTTFRRETGSGGCGRRGRAHHGGPADIRAVQRPINVRSPGDE